MSTRKFAALILASGIAFLPLYGETSLTQPNSGPIYTEVVDKATTPLLSPSLKERKTKKFKLENGLQVYLVSDPDAEQASGALVVETGSWEEPKDHPGLAHFLEHMLFLGTASYPDEGGYHRYITQHGGIDNAFTSNDSTAYVFSINNDALEGALDRFASFFKEPLFNPSGVSRELNAIDQEYAKNIENDSFRLQHAIKVAIRPDHPESGFHMGNSKSLANTTPEDLRKWFQDHYSANIMKLAVTSSLPLDEMKKMVVSAFSGIPNNNRPPFSVQGPLLKEDVSGSIIYVEPFQNERNLAILWEVPQKFAAMIESQPGKVICNLVGDEGKTSLLAQLKRESLATSLACGLLPESRENKFFYVDIGLTEEGLKKFPVVIERLYQTMALLRKEGIPLSLFEEYQKQEMLDYQFQERRTAFKEAMYHAQNLPNESLETYPERAELLAQYDPLAIENLLRYLTPQNAQILITAPYRETRVKSTDKEPWLGVDYAIKPLPRNLFSKWLDAAPHDAITLPEPNPFIPGNLSVLAFNGGNNPASGKVPPNRGVPFPAVLLNDASGKVYYALDSLYQVPKVNYTFTIRTPEITPARSRTIALAELYAKCVQDSLNDISYTAQLAGLNFSIKSADNQNGIRIQVQGYSDKSSQLFDVVVKHLMAPGCDESKFNRYKDLLLRSYADKALDMPVQQAIEDLKNILYKDFATAKEKESALKKISLEEYREFVKNLFTSNYIEGVIYGNVTQKEAQKVLQKLRATLGGSDYPPSKHFKKEFLILPNDKGPYYWEDTIQAQGNAALLALEGGMATYKKRASQQILMQAMREGFFQDLRTRQQTGYLVYSGGEEMEGELVDYFAVQSSTHDARDLLARFELFIEDYLKEIETEKIPQARFEILRNALTEQMMQQPNDLDSMAELIYQLAFDFNGAFDRPEKRVEAFKALTYQEFIEDAKETLGKGNKRRLGLLLRGPDGEKPIFRYEKVRSRGGLREDGKFRPFPVEISGSEGSGESQG